LADVPVRTFPPPLRPPCPPSPFNTSSSQENQIVARVVIDFFFIELPFLSVPFPSFYAIFSTLEVTIDGGIDLQAPLSSGSFFNTDWNPVVGVLGWVPLLVPLAPGSPPKLRLLPKGARPPGCPNSCPSQTILLPEKIHPPFPRVSRNFRNGPPGSLACAPRIPSPWSINLLYRFPAGFLLGH